MEKRNTIQKQLVLQAVAELAKHPTAEEVYAFIVREHPTISKATVYRNLTSLSEDGKLRHIKMPGGADRFDHQIFGHHHIECTECGCVADVPLDDAAALDARAARQTGYTGVSHDIVFRGVCPNCTQYECDKKS